MLSLKEICVKYVEWVSRNPQTTSEIENSVKYISYFLAGRISNSSIISELVYSVSNLVVLFNDNIIRGSQPLHCYGSAHRLKTLLTVLEYSEVFIEVSALHSWGKTGKWIIVILIQMFKCVARLILLYRYKENIIQKPPVIPLKRSELNQPLFFEPPPEGFTLNSGRVIRSVESSAPLVYRSWMPPELPKGEPKEDATLAPAQVFGEVLYITKPLAHLAVMYSFGQKNWKPWVLAFTMDLISLQLLKRGALPGSRLSLRQRVELSRRNVSLLLYLMRSPFYESQTRDRLQRLLSSCSSNIPLVGVILRPLSEYIPRWQDTYFYMWSA